MKKMKRESELKSALMRELRAHLPSFVHIRHEDRITSGIPDISSTGGGRTVWLECKHATPGFSSEGIQELTMLRLAAAGQAWYIVWEEKRGVKRTLIVHPRYLHALVPEAFCVGFDHAFVCNWRRNLLI